ncbi:hypothetical protein COEREDRAFT_10534 [Coemansia reversa NRRL 1564]|uniref:Expansin-like EG45 domain-containing protein n=1 Tax=Coemansia reversa (strain ATCC 12441 / NRRL 1564) TaxID=763665 RepID=A0A2G5B6J3_COERN|nr:hypothetical protein COEREDRAFT_10534 [Coemansia reversa NRRL 1564]|eukprot:PIA14337.1 hypothetical protein COEREDRAFT_10534 [Coemansia reversa NRRL 1564]
MHHPIVLVVLVALVTTALGNMYGRQSITPHDYQSLGNYLAASAPSCGYPYVTLDISRITAVQLMAVGSECGTCLRIEASPADYIEDGASVGLPAVAMASNFAATTTSFAQLPTTTVIEQRSLPTHSSIRRRSEDIRYVYVLAVDTGGRGLDLAQVSFTALFGQSMSPMEATWFPVDDKYCEDIWRNTTKKQLESPTEMSDIPVRKGRSIAPDGLGPVGNVVDIPISAAPQSTSHLAAVCAIALFVLKISAI